MTQLTDHELRARFHALRELEEMHAPGFRAVLERTAHPASESTRTRSLSQSRVVLSLAAAAAILLAVGLAQRASRPREFTAQPLSTWTSPTASLLRTPGYELIESPALLPSVLDRVTSTSVQRRGN